MSMRSSCFFQSERTPLKLLLLVQCLCTLSGLFTHFSLLFAIQCAQSKSSKKNSPPLTQLASAVPSSLCLVPNYEHPEPLGTLTLDPQPENLNPAGARSQHSFWLCLGPGSSRGCSVTRAQGPGQRGHCKPNAAHAAVQRWRGPAGRCAAGGYWRRGHFKEFAWIVILTDHKRAALATS